jgi:NAD(P) transhydrogenase
MASNLTAPLIQGGDTGPIQKLGVLKESKVGVPETRVSLVADSVKQLVSDKYQVFVERDAGVAASQTNEMYEKAGASITDRASVISKSDVIFAINPPADFSGMRGKVVISWVSSRLPEGKALVAKAQAAGVTLLDVTMVPRITIAQKLDVLSSQGKVAGHRAVIEASTLFGRFHQSEMTAAGKYPPSETIILGCGVAGLAAIGTSRALGSQVKAWDVRDAAKEQVESMGAKWITVDFKEDAAGAGGYAKACSAEFEKKQHEVFEQHMRTADIVITTAAIPGAPSPVLIREDMVKVMKPGSVIIDLAAVGGGNCKATERGKVVQKDGVWIVGYEDLPGRMAQQASAMYGQNMVNLVRHIAEKGKTNFVQKLMANLMVHVEKSGEAEPVSSAIVCCFDGKVNTPPPPPANLGKQSKKGPAKSAKKVADPNPFGDAFSKLLVLTVAFLAILGMGQGGPKVEPILRSFLLSGAAGYQAVWGVAHALHTPLMAVTNAISGLTVVGGMKIFTKVWIENSSDIKEATLFLGAVSVAVSTVNIFGGFIVTHRMLSLFKRKEKDGSTKKEDEDYTSMLLLLVVLLCGWDFQVGGSSPVVESICSCLCIGAIACLATHKTANLGCKLGVMGVITAVIVTFISCFQDLSRADADVSTALCFLAGSLGAGAVLGMIVGASADPMKLPQTVAAFHSLVGLAAMMTSVAAYMKQPHEAFDIENISAVLGNIIGAITLTGSIIAFLKLDGRMKSKEWNLPFKNFINIGLALACFGLGFLVCTDVDLGIMCMCAIAGISCVLGVHLVASVGGGDMPVCVTVLNSYSGWALAAEGFNLSSPLLAAVGAVIGFSGAILTKIMCDAMNRDIMNVIFGGMNVAAPASKGDEGPKSDPIETNANEVAALLADANKVAIVPGYGMAQARAQGPVGMLASQLRERGVECNFVIHPVAGRMPGQMNVLLAEADVPHDWVKEMDEVNDHLDGYDVCICIGSNDIVNSAAEEIPDCSIAGMPVIQVWKSKKVVFMKRSLGGGYADLENPVFRKENTLMFLGDGKKKVEELLKVYGEIKGAA